MIRRDKLLLLIPALWASLFDIIITTIHQPKEYWNGDLHQANEGNPIGAMAMENHVSGLFVISTLWILLIILLGYILPRQAGKAFLLFCVLAHSFGVSTWLNRYGFWPIMLFFLLTSILYCFIDNFVNKKEKTI